MWCFHKWGEIKKSYQYCTKCGVARAVKCAHQWVKVAEHKVLHTSIHERGLSKEQIEKRAPDGILFVLQCERCGEVTRRKV